jgi:hypothetical protein
VFYPTGLGVDLRKFFLRDRDYCACVVEDDSTRAGCSLVNRQDVLFAHTLSPLRKYFYNFSNYKRKL